jgi:hypothetical protein
MLNTLETNRHIVTKNLLNYCTPCCVYEFKLSYVLRMLFFQCLRHQWSAGLAELHKICSCFDPNRIVSMISGMRNRLQCYSFRLDCVDRILLKQLVLTFLRFISYKKILQVSYELIRISLYIASSHRTAAAYGNKRHLASGLL